MQTDLSDFLLHFISISGFVMGLHFISICTLHQHTEHLQLLFILFVLQFSFACTFTVLLPFNFQPSRWMFISDGPDDHFAGQPNRLPIYGPRLCRLQPQTILKIG
ncbi:hypothetical protein HanRHA438_Chr01g0004041 [Helianthus annuus]|nr:hypothetical protein HanRHA438_Chr01g0004041 [Helianthus annuus]